VSIAFLPSREGPDDRPARQGRGGVYPAGRDAEMRQRRAHQVPDDQRERGGVQGCHGLPSSSPGAQRKRGEPSSGPPRLENYFRAALFQPDFSGVGQSRIDAVAERTDVVAQRTVGAVDHDRDGRQDERVFRHRLATGAANHGLTNPDKELRYCPHSSHPLLTAFLVPLEVMYCILFCLDVDSHNDIKLTNLPSFHIHNTHNLGNLASRH
jgi:hypothetical protein